MRTTHTLTLTLSLATLAAVAALTLSAAHAIPLGDPEWEPDGPGAPPPDCDDDCTQGSCSRPAAWVDRDYDGVPDRLEYDLAHKFFPNVLLQHHDVDRDESYLYQGASIPFTVRPLREGLCDSHMECLEIRYGIAFFYDHGDAGLFHHVGDSEMYAVVVRRTRSWTEARELSTWWAMIRDFTSAHWGHSSSDSSQLGAYGFCPECVDRGYCTGSQQYCYGFGDEATCNRWGACRWRPVCTYEGGARCYSSSPRTSYANIWSAESKHALYHSHRECDRGGFYGSDDCPRTDYAGYQMRWWRYGKLQNVGNAEHHFNFDTSIQDPDGCGQYGVWSGDRFGDSTGYRHNFTAPLNWAL